MAMLINKIYRGIPVNKAYASIDMQSLTMGKTEMSFAVIYCADENQLPFLAEPFTAPYSIEGPNPFEQAYTHLKTLPEFADAEDC